MSGFGQAASSNERQVFAKLKGYHAHSITYRKTQDMSTGQQYSNNTKYDLLYQPHILKTSEHLKVMVCPKEQTGLITLQDKT